jgi:prophage DNA circulation protein
MGVFSFVKGFMKGYKEGGIIEGIKQGIFGLFDTIIGSVLELGAKLASFVLKFFGLNNAAEAIKESMAMILDGVKNVFGGLIDLVKGIFTLDGALIMESLGKIWDGIKDIFMAGPNYFMALIKDIFGSNEEGEGGLVNKIKSLYQRIKDFLSAPLEKITGLLNKLNPFADDSAAQIKEKIAKEQERIRRSQAGENEYVGREGKGVEDSLEKIAELEAKLANMKSVNEMKMIPNTTGAQMEATQNDTLIAKEAKTNIAPVFNTTDASTNTSNIVSTSTNQSSHMDRTMGMGLGNMLLQ